jgi:hypothetical protein
MSLDAEMREGARKQAILRGRKANSYAATGRSTKFSHTQLIN